MADYLYEKLPKLGPLKYTWAQILSIIEHCNKNIIGYVFSIQFYFDSFEQFFVDIYNICYSETKSKIEGTTTYGIDVTKA